MKAFILIETTAGKAKAKEVITVLKQLDEVKSVDIVTSPYDVIAILEAENMTNIVAKIKAIPGISRTVVCMGQNK
ncbi:hypothetical protein ES705_49144 [subsurface metagenome]